MFIELFLASLKIIFILFIVLSIAGLLGWVERKQSAVMQDRIGANRADIFGFRVIGLFHPLADAIKLITKEDFIPPFADKGLHTLAPFMTLFFSLVAFAVLPFGSELYIKGRGIPLQIVNLDIGILYIFAMMSLVVFGVLIAGTASKNNYAFLGGIRAASQMISYEIILGSSIMGIIMAYGSLNLMEIVEKQGDLLWGMIPKWGILLQPLGFLLFMTAVIAETKRIPFDLPEGESEIIGYHIEYSGMKFGMFMMTDFVETIMAAGVLTTLFFGGWQIPFLFKEGFLFPMGITVKLPHLIVILLQFLSFLIKVLFFCWVLMLIRWTLPRFRYDQVMRLGWKFMLPLSLANILITGIIIILFI
ncbi:MAG TPA: complex I subunit 1 family protein [Nitrospinota bacterium]|nr:complex I subunit 1 family protein [Nitrospinota bacterium]